MLTFMTPQGWKTFFGISSLLFLLFAFWQINDPDLNGGCRSI